MHLLARTAKSGLGSAYRAGFGWGMERGYDVFIEIDADFSHDPAALPSLVAPLENGYDVSIGSRYIEGGAIPNWAWHRHLLSRGGNMYASAVLGSRGGRRDRGLPGLLGGHSAAHRPRADPGRGLRLPDRDDVPGARSRGARITEVPISFVDREAGESKMSSFIVVEALGLVTWWGLGRLVHPLRRGHTNKAMTTPRRPRRPGHAGGDAATDRDRYRRRGSERRRCHQRHSAGRARPRRGSRALDMTVDAPPARILVVDDEPNIADLLSAALTFEGYQVGVAGTGAEALEQVRTFRPHLVMLDVMLPDFDGNEVCRRLRNQGEHMPIVFLTARDTTEDKVEGLSMGDDYVTKPFSVEELMARVGAILRRAGEMAAADTSTLRFADLAMNVDTHEVWRDDLPIELTATEFNLLRYLLENARRVISKSELLDNVWGFDFHGDPNIVETYISYLRKKIDDREPALIHTIRRVGYTLRLPRDG